MKAAIYARVSTHEQQTLEMQTKALSDYATNRNWKVVMTVCETASGVKARQQREQLITAAHRREIDVILVWKLDRWGRSLQDLVNTLQDLSTLGVGFVSLTEAVDFTTPSGKAMTGMLAVFAQFERDMLTERIKAGIAHARTKGKPHGRPKSAALKTKQAIQLKNKGMNISQIARELDISRTSVRRLLNEKASA